MGVLFSDILFYDLNEMIEENADSLYFRLNDHRINKTAHRTVETAHRIAEPLIEPRKPLIEIKSKKILAHRDPNSRKSKAISSAVLFQIMNLSGL